MVQALKGVKVVEVGAAVAMPIAGMLMEIASAAAARLFMNIHILPVKEINRLERAAFRSASSAIKLS